MTGRSTMRDPCIDEEFFYCEAGPCAYPRIENHWIKFKCPDHGGPGPAVRAEMIAKEKKKGRYEEIVERKGVRLNEWHGAVCTIL